MSERIAERGLRIADCGRRSAMRAKGRGDRRASFPACARWTFRPPTNSCALPIGKSAIQQTWKLLCRNLCEYGRKVRYCSPSPRPSPPGEGETSFIRRDIGAAIPSFRHGKEGFYRATWKSAPRGLRLKRTEVAKSVQKRCETLQVVRLCPPLPAFARLCPPFFSAECGMRNWESRPSGKLQDTISTAFFRIFSDYFALSSGGEFLSRDARDGSRVRLRPTEDALRGARRSCERRGTNFLFGEAAGRYP
jgi:hypothetical protein